MARTLEQIQVQIDKLQKQAEQLKNKERHQVVARIRDAIKFYALSPGDLFGEGGPSAKATRGPGKAKKASSPRPAVKRGRTVPIKFRDTNGNAWSGRGSRPRWLVAALAEGKRLEDFAV